MSKYYSLVSKIVESLNEETSSVAIAYLPDGFTSVRQTILGLADKKAKWGIKVIESEKEYNVTFEDQLKINIPKEHFQHFRENVLEIANTNEVDLGKLFNLAIKEGVAVAEDALLEVIEGLRKNPVVLDSAAFASYWVSEFKYTHILPVVEKHLFDLFNYTKSITKVSSSLRDEFQGDRGYLETIASAIEEGKPLSKIPAFSKYPFLAACKIQSTYQTVRMVLDLRIKMDFTPKQFITIYNQEVLEELEYYREVHVVKNLISPVSGMFRNSFIENIKDVIHSID